jgi:hypothetical protein
VRARSTAAFRVAIRVGQMPEIVDQAASKLRGLKVISTSASSVELSRSITWRTWGERLTVTFSQLDDLHTDVSIESRPSLPTTLTDYGQGAIDIRRLHAAIVSAANG